MDKRVILTTGTPRVGKTTIARLLASKLDASYVNLTELATTEGLVLDTDTVRDSLIVDEKKMRQRIGEIIRTSDKENIVIDGHYAANVVPEQLVSHVFVLRRNPKQLKRLMEQSNFAENKISENLASEILDVCLVDALNAHEQEKVCEIDVTGKSARGSVNEILEILNGSRKCCVGIVDWLGTLENEGILDGYLKI
jgi:adenylate kinase